MNCANSPTLYREKIPEVDCDRVQRSKDIIIQMIKESKGLNHNHVGTEHLLLALLHFKDGVASQVLTNLGIKVDKVRLEIERIFAVN